MRSINKEYLEEDNIIDNNRLDEKEDELEIIDLDKELEDDLEALGPIFRDVEDEEWVKEQEEEKRKKANKESLRKEICSWIITLVVTLGCIFILKNYVIINALVPTGSMENTIMPDDQLFGNRLAYLFDEPERGDIIFFYYPDDPNHEEKFVKRIIGLPGEKVVIDNGKIYINDSEEPLEEPYLKEEWVIKTGLYEFQVPEGCYFVLGDNRNTSRDARDWNNPYVAREEIIGQAGFIYYPLDRIGVVE